ncbi:MAG: RIP metalloprotease RseP [bacterium]|nr:RIP metalloprotease RseP [bacterium]
MLLTVLSFVVVIGVIILVHEWGHFIAARLVGIRVETFSIGFGPALWKRRRGPTEYRLAWFPLGGYVKMAGMIDESLDGEDKITGASDEFMSKRSWQKAFVISAGVLMNGLLAVLLYVLIAWFWGVGRASEEPVLGGLRADMPAQLAGLRVGDRVLRVDDEPVLSWADLAGSIHQRPGREVLLLVLRPGPTGADTLAIRVLPVEALQPGTGKVGLIGIEPQVEIVPAGLGQSVTAGLRKTWAECQMAYRTVAALLSGEAGLKDLGGPILIAQMSGESARGGLVVFLSFMAFISVNIGFLNILPIPVLDGGHLVYIGIEAAIRRPLPNRLKLWIQQAGMILLLLVMVLVMKNDVMRLVQRERPAAQELQAPGGER